MNFTPGGGLPVNVAYSLSALVAFAFMLLPGLGIAWGLGRRAKWSVAGIVGASFAAGLFTVGVLALAAHYAHLSLTVLLVASVVAFLAMTVGGILLGRGGERLAGGWQGLALGAFAAVVAVYERPWFAQRADTFYHLAAVRSLLVTGRPMVTDPFYGTNLRILDPTTGVWHTYLALMAKSTGLDVMWLWPGATAVGAAMTALGFWLLARAVSRSDVAASVATAGLLLFPLALDMRWFAYPNRMSLALVFLALAALVGLMEAFSVADAALLIAAGFSAISLHMAAAAAIVIAALFLGVLLGVAVLVGRVRQRKWDWQPLASLAVTGVVLAAVSAPLLLPKASVVSTSPLVTYGEASVLAQTKALAGGRWLVARPEMIGDSRAILFGSLLLGLAAAAVAFRRGDRRALAAFGVAVLPVALLMDPPLTTVLLHRSLYLTSRVAILLPFTAFVAIAWGLGQWREKRALGWLAVAVAVGVLGVGWSDAQPALQRNFARSQATGQFSAWTSRKVDIRYTWGPDVIAKIARETGGRYVRFGGDVEATYYLSGILPISVVSAPPKHAPFAVEEIDGGMRRADMDELIDPATSPAERRRILARWDVDYVIVPNVEKSRGIILKLQAQPDALQTAVDSRSLIVFRVRKPLAAAYPTNPTSGYSRTF